MNPSITLTTSQFAAFSFKGVDASGNQKPIHGTVVISDYSKAFAFIGPNCVDLFVKTPPAAGTSLTFSASINAFDQNGAALPAVQLDVTMQGDPLPDPATSVQVGTPVAVNPGNTDFGVPVDPGSGTVSFSF